MSLTISSVAGERAIASLSSANSDVKQEAAISAFNAANEAQQSLVDLVSTIAPPADSGRGKTLDVKA
ncbi:MAG: hypothetical protein ING44_19150 [Telmatospirillum sp.]|nr:hypothetical protein [Telmatospirillum sp.]